jgi:hypothetical protein
VADRISQNIWTARYRPVVHPQLYVPTYNSLSYGTIPTTDDKTQFLEETYYNQLQSRNRTQNDRARFQILLTGHAYDHQRVPYCTSFWINCFILRQVNFHGPHTPSWRMRHS